eukprot:13473683-Alexandrium_andersonii.AAC.1
MREGGQAVNAHTPGASSVPGILLFRQAHAQQLLTSDHLPRSLGSKVLLPSLSNLHDGPGMSSIIHPESHRRPLPRYEPSNSSKVRSRVTPAMSIERLLGDLKMKPDLVFATRL